MFLYLVSFRYYIDISVKNTRRTLWSARGRALIRTARVHSGECHPNRGMEVNRSLPEPSRITRRSRPHRRSCCVCPNPKGEFISNHNPCSMERTQTGGRFLPPSRGQTRHRHFIAYKRSMKPATFCGLFHLRCIPSLPCLPIKLDRLLSQLCIMMIIYQFFIALF